VDVSEADERSVSNDRDVHKKQTKGGNMSGSEQQAPRISRSDLQRRGVSVPADEVVESRVEIGPAAPFVSHPRPGRS
jgi:hypothetical protein